MMSCATQIQVPDSLAGFQQYGFARFDGCISRSELQLLGEIYDELFTDAESKSGFINLGGSDEGGQLLMPQIGMPSRLYPALQELDYFKYLTGLAKELLGPDAAFRNDHMILKPAGSTRDTPWHQDQAYHSPAFRYANVNFWLPLDGADIEDGCLWFVPFTHGGAVVAHENNYNAGGATAVSAKDQEYWQGNGVAVPCPAGGISAHHSYCMHYAAANKSLRPRRAWINVFACPPLELAYPLSMPWQDERVKKS